VAELHIGYFVGDDFPKSLDHVFKTLQDKKTKALIIDLRANGGGHDQYGALLISYLRDAPFAYFDHIDVKTVDPSFIADTNLTRDALDKLRAGTEHERSGGFRITPAYHSGLSLQSPQKNSFMGPVYVLTDGNTFSTAADVCAVLRHLKRAVFMGEETGGAYFGNNSGLEAILKLPNSGVKVTVPLFGYWNAVTEKKNTRRGTQVDYVEPTTVQSLIDGRDDELSRALDLISSDPT
jgi:C-terminal processing protease CtpA/Prc